jgi:hypothetical protein
MPFKTRSYKKVQKSHFSLYIIGPFWYNVKLGDGLKTEQDIEDWATWVIKKSCRPALDSYISSLKSIIVL